MNEKQLPARAEYHKLVRDAIPEIIRRGGQTCKVVTLTEEEYPQALREKLIEEAYEAAEAPENNLITEIADLYEVLDSLMRYHNINEEQVRDVQTHRRAERGGFERRLQLLWVQ